jgi:hypothetical protein
MKKQLILILAVMLMGLLSCQKEKEVKAPAESSSPNKLRVNVVQPTFYYVDLTLQPRQPGETFDTYYAYYHNEKITVRGNPVYNTSVYPTLVNGVPTQGGSLGVTTIADAISTSTSGDQQVFALTVGSTGNFNFQAFQADFDKYNTAMDNYIKNTASYPIAYDYIKATYTSAAGFNTYSGKLIRVTTGSHWAIATIDYPVPARSAPTISDTFIYISDPDPARPSISYQLRGIKGNIANASVGINGQYGNTLVPVTGAYTAISSSFTLHYYGTLFRTDGTSFTFDMTGDVN